MHCIDFMFIKQNMKEIYPLFEFKKASYFAEPIL